MASMEGCAIDQGRVVLLSLLMLAARVRTAEGGRVLWPDEEGVSSAPLFHWLAEGCAIKQEMAWDVNNEPGFRERGGAACMVRTWRRPEIPSRMRTAKLRLERHDDQTKLRKSTYAKHAALAPFIPADGSPLEYLLSSPLWSQSLA